MKAFIVCLAIAAATAEPQWLYGSPLVHSMATPFTYMAKPIEYKKVEYKPIEYKKIELKPVEYKMPEIKPIEYKTLTTTPMVYNTVPVAHHIPMVYNMMPATLKTYSNDRKDDGEYAEAGKYVAENAGAIHIAKRDAESQFIGYNALLYAWNNAAYMPYAWNKAAVMPYAWNKAAVMPYAWNHGVQPYAWAMPAQVKTLDDARMKIDTPEYANKGKYVAESAGAIHIAKREAESQFIGYNALPYAWNNARVMPYAWNNAHVMPYAWNNAAPYWNNLAYRTYTL